MHRQLPPPLRQDPDERREGELETSEEGTACIKADSLAGVRADISSRSPAACMMLAGVSNAPTGQNPEASA